MDLFSNRLLMYQPYKKNEIIFEKAVSGNYNLEIKISGKYEVCIIGAGGGGGVSCDQAKYNWKSSAGAGASGGAFKGIVFLKAGIYPITVGEAGISRVGNNIRAGWWTGTSGGLSSLSDKIIANGGGYGGACWTDGNPGRYGGTGGSIIVDNFISAEINSNGISGGSINGVNTAQGGESLFDGHGKGSTVWTQNWSGGGGYDAATSGYVKVKFVSLK